MLCEDTSTQPPPALRLRWILPDRSVRLDRGIPQTSGEGPIPSTARTQRGPRLPGHLTRGAEDQRTRRGHTVAHVVRCRSCRSCETDPAGLGMNIRSRHVKILLMFSRQDEPLKILEQVAMVYHFNCRSQIQAVSRWQTRFTPKLLRSSSGSVITWGCHPKYE